MQTFVPYADFERSARALDDRRLGKQRVETIQIVRALTVPGYAWASHPAVLMWKGYEEALGRYGLTCCDVWLERGFGDTCAATIATDLRHAGVRAIRSAARAPRRRICSRLGSTTSRSSEVTSRRSFARTRTSTACSSRASRLTSRTSGRSGPSVCSRRNGARRRTPLAEPSVRPTSVAPRARRSRAAKRGWATRRSADQGTGRARSGRVIRTPARMASWGGRSGMRCSARSCASSSVAACSADEDAGLPSPTPTHHRCDHDRPPPDADNDCAVHRRDDDRDASSLRRTRCRSRRSPSGRTTGGTSSSARCSRRPTRTRATS